MINIIAFDDRPMKDGEGRELILTGDSPFQLTISCFVDEPRPPGFRPCAACGTFTVNSMESFTVRSTRGFWRGKEGSLIIGIVDAAGDSTRLVIKVLGDSTSTPSSMSA